MKALQTLVFVGIAGVLTSPRLKAQEPERRPNILFLFADDWGQYASCYRNIDGSNAVNSVVETPNIDRFAKEGVLFSNAYVPVPSSTPCRSSILSGQYFYRTGMGAILQGAKWDETIPTYPPILREHGYHIGYTYKVWAPGNVPNEPYGGGKDNKLDSAEIAERNPKPGKKWYFSNPGDELAYESGGRDFNNFSQYVSKNEDTEKAKEELLDEVRQNFTSFLADGKQGQPFCYWFGPTNTHRQWIKGSGKKLWGIDPDMLKGKMPAFLPDVPEIREDFSDYLGEVCAWDAAVGVFYEILKERGELNNTLVVISGDHGIPGFPRGKTNLYELGTKVALIVSYPGKYKGNRVVHDFINLMDLAPTFLEVAGLKAPGIMNGKSIVHILASGASGMVDPTRNFVFSGRERHVARAREGNLPYPQRAIRTKDFLYIRNFKPDRNPVGTIENGLPDIDNGPTKTWFIKNHGNPKYEYEWTLAFGLRPYEELYKIQEDPFEMNNLAGNPEYDAIKSRLATKMDSIMVITKDPRINNDDCVFDQMPYIIAP